jgi:hypothetical protein
MDTEPHQTMRVWTKTHKLLRLIAASTDESMVEVMQRLAQAEYEHIRNEEIQDESCKRLQDRDGSHS